jgi:hypothetical protein
MVACGLAMAALSGSGCAAVVIGGVAAGGAAAAAFAYHNGDAHLDFAAPWEQTRLACLAALQDLSLPVEQQVVEGDHGEIQSRAPDGETIHLSLETIATGGNIPPVTRVHIRVGVFGNKAMSQQIHTQIANRLQGMPLAPTTVGGASQPNGTISSAPPGSATLPAETVPPPLAGSAEASPTAPAASVPGTPIVPAPGFQGKAPGK